MNVVLLVLGLLVAFSLLLLASFLLLVSLRPRHWWVIPVGWALAAVITWVLFA